MLYSPLLTLSCTVNSLEILHKQTLFLYLPETELPSFLSHLDLSLELQTTLSIGIFLPLHKEGNMILMISCHATFS